MMPCSNILLPAELQEELGDIGISYVSKSSPQEEKKKKKRCFQFFHMSIVRGGTTSVLSRFSFSMSSCLN